MSDEHKHSRILCCECIHRDIATRVQAQERAAIVAFLRRVDWNTWRDHTGELEDFNGDHADLVREVAAMLERGEHVKEAK